MKYILLITFIILVFVFILLILKSDRKYKDLLHYTKRLKSECRKLYDQVQSLSKLIQLKNNDISVKILELDSIKNDLQRAIKERDDIQAKHQELLKYNEQPLCFFDKNQKNYEDLLVRFEILRIENHDLNQKYINLASWVQDNLGNFQKTTEKSQESKNIHEGFLKYGVKSLWHMTHRININSICNNGLLSHNDAHTIPDVVDISNNEVQARRSRLDTIYSRPIHDYVPLYINIRNPMLYAKKDLQNDICIIEISLDALSKDNYLISNGNVASQITELFNSIDQLECIPWDILHTDFWHDKVDGKRKRCSEVLVYPSIPPKYIKAIHCYSAETKDYIKQCGKPVVLSKNLYF